MAAPTPASALSPTADISASVLPVLLFAVAHTVIAVPLSAVIRVIRTPDSLLRQTQEINLMYWDSQEITVLNLYPRLAPTSAPPQQSLPPFVVLLSSQRGESYGLPIQDPPQLFNLPLNQIRPLPESYRHSLSVDLASRMAVLARPGSPLTVFLLDLERVIAALLA